MITPQEQKEIRENLGTNVVPPCIKGSSHLICYCGKCKPGDYPLPKDFGKQVIGIKIMKEKLPKCHDCFVLPGECHTPGCDTEKCSVCGEQWISCGHKKHNPLLAKWEGEFPWNTRR